MKIKNFLAILPFLAALHGFASPVTSDDAGNAVRVWVKRGNTLGASLSSAIEKVSTLTTTNGATFYAVKTLGGGTVFTSSNDELEPILAFTSDETDFETINERSPLWALLNRDVSCMNAGSSVLKSRSIMASAATAEASTNESRAKAKWRSLLEEAEADGISAATGITLFSSMVMASSSLASIGDVRVAPIVKTKWSQTTHNDELTGEKCYNYYTPNNFPSGCGATAMAQIMKTLKYPTSIGTDVDATYYIEEESSEAGTVSTNKYTGKLNGGVYDWDNMTLQPNTDSSLSEVNRQAIGKIMADAGMAAQSVYSAEGTASWDCTVRNAFAKVFNFKNATLYTDQNMNCFSGSPNHIRTNATARMMWSNFDAGIPVFVAVPGHAIVADGYGFNEGVDYTHFNLGWSGQSDLWYNIPDLSSADSDFTDVNSVVYNLFTKEGESAATAVLSGRAVRNSSAVSGAKVRIYRTGTTELVKEAVANAYGVFGVTVPSGNYDIEVEASDGSSAGAVYNIKALAPQTTSVNFVTDLTIVPTENVVRVPTTTTLAEIGNSWGNDVDLSSVAASDALAKAVIGSEVKYYNSLDMLFRECRNGATITLLKDCSSEQFCNITNIVITNASYKIVSDGEKRTIHPGDKIHFDIKTDGSLTLENIRFEGYNGERLFNVAGGSLTLNSGAELAELNAKDYNYAAIMIQNEGVFTMNSGSLIEKCEALRGGAIAAKNGEVKLLGGTISSNSASYGAGVYAENNGNGSVQISLGGDISFDSNSDNKKESDIYVGTNNGFVTIVNRLTGGKVGIEYFNRKDEFGNAAGKRACAIASTLTSDDINNSKSRIYNTAYPDFIVQLENISGINYFAWAGNDSNGPCDELDGVVKIDGKYYASLADGFANLGANSLIEVVKDCDLDSIVTFTNKNASEIMLQSLPSSGIKTITRTSKGGRIVIEGAKVAFSNITICDQLPVGSAGGRLVEVKGGGTLSLRGGSLIKDVVCSTDRSSSAVYVNGATVKMSLNATIENCTNTYYNSSSTPDKVAAAIMVENRGSAIFTGGTISSCSTEYGSAVVISNGSSVSIEGSFTIADCMENRSGNSAGLYVADLSGLSLAGPYTGSTGYTEGVKAHAAIFGKAENWESTMTTKDTLMSSANNFYHDTDGATGVAVVAEGSSDALLVWSSAMQSGGVFTDNGVNYKLVTDKTIVDIPVPATTNFKYSAGVTHTVLSAAAGYTVSGNSAEAIGDYVATATLSDGYIWNDGTSAPKTWAWSIYDPNAKPEPPEPSYETVVCQNFSFTAIARNENGNWLLTIKPATAFCKYELYTGKDLPAINELLETVEVMQEGDIGSDGSYTFRPIASGTEKRFWKVKGYDGQKKVSTK